MCPLGESTPNSFLFMRIMSWNCQGMGSKEAFRTLIDLLSCYKIDALILVETKISGEKADGVCSKLKFDNWVKVECFGYSGGIWLFWNDTIGTIQVLASTRNLYTV